MRARFRARSSIALLVVACLGAAAPAFAQTNAQKKPITHDGYDGWKSIQGTKLSPDGTWLAYALTPQEGDGELVVKNLKTNAEIRAPRGRDPLITGDNHFVVYAIAPLRKDVDQARKAKRPEDMPKSGLGFVNLSSGQTTTLAEHVKSFRIPDETPQVVVFLSVAAPPAANGATPSKGREKKATGTDLVIRDLYTGTQTTLAEVSDYAVSKNGAWLVYGVSSKTPAGDGAFARGLGNGAKHTLLQRSRRLQVRGAALHVVPMDHAGRQCHRAAGPRQCTDDCQRERPPRILEGWRTSLVRNGAASSG